MATKPKSSSTSKSATVKKNAPKKAASKASPKKSPSKNKTSTKSKAAKTSTKASSARKTISPSTKIVAQPKETPRTQIESADSMKEKKAVEAGKAFDKKIDEMAKTTSVSEPEGKSKNYSKTIIGVIIIILAVLIYFFFGRKKTAVIEEEIKPMEPAPAPKIEEIKPAETAVPEEEATVYTVKYKDQLTEISQELYGTYSEWKRIFEANKDKIKDPNLIYPGQKFVIPKIQKTE